MPQYVSKNGLWHAADLAAKAELKVRGVETLGVEAKTKNPVMAEPQNELPKVGTDNKFPEMRKRGEVPKK